MIKLSQLISTTLLTSAILIAIGRSPPPKAQDTILPYSAPTSTYLTQRQIEEGRRQEAGGRRSDCRAGRINLSGKHTGQTLFPPDKGDPRWQKPTEKLFLGIDHTAIAITDTETSRQFYQDLLGLDIAGESENYGTEQEHLNNVKGARLRITGLKADAGMGVEFLEYLQPRHARSLPEATTPKDLIHWETTLIVKDADLAAEKLRQGGYQFVSDGIAEINEPTLGFPRAFLVRDPDGHVLRIVQRFSEQ